MQTSICNKSRRGKGKDARVGDIFRMRFLTMRLQQFSHVTSSDLHTKQMSHAIEQNNTEADKGQAALGQISTDFILAVWLKTL